jgi:hypothetical protein
MARRRQSRIEAIGSSFQADQLAFGEMKAGDTLLQADGSKETTTGRANADPAVRIVADFCGMP